MGSDLNWLSFPVGSRQKTGWYWSGDAKGLIDTVANGDARLGFVTDVRSNAKVSMNINGSDDPEATEPFYIESPDGDNLYDASNRKEAVLILSNIRKGKKYPDMPDATPKHKSTKPKSKKKSKKSGSTSVSMRGIR